MSFGYDDLTGLLDTRLMPESPEEAFSNWGFDVDGLRRFFHEGATASAEESNESKEHDVEISLAIGFMLGFKAAQEMRLREEASK